MVIMDTGESLVEVFTPEALNEKLNPGHAVDTTIVEQRKAIDTHKKSIQQLEGKIKAFDSQRNEMLNKIQKLKADKQELLRWKESGVYHTSQMIVAVIMTLVIASTCLAFYLMTRPAF